MERVDVGLATGATEEQLREWRLLVLGEMGEEQLEEFVGKVEDVDCGWRDDGAMARHLSEEGGLHFKYPGVLWGGGKGWGGGGVKNEFHLLSNKY